MRSELSVEAPAKINWHLDILDRRQDGFHNLVSLFQSISLTDRLRFRSLKKQEEYKLKGNFSFPPEENIITRAVTLFRRETGLLGGVEIEVQKEIPAGAGLGGGSSDAAATLAGLNRLFNAGLSAEKLGHLGAVLGSDVPFFLQAACAIVTGRGEQITPLTPRGDFLLLVICPDFTINTARAYAWLDEDRGHQNGAPPLLTPAELATCYQTGNIPDLPLDNSFRDVLFRRYEEYKEIFHTLKDSGACYTNISGSGSAVYGIFTRKEKLERAYELFTGRFSFTRMAQPLDKRPSFIVN